MAAPPSAVKRWYAIISSHTFIRMANTNDHTPEYIELTWDKLGGDTVMRALFEAFYHNIGTSRIRHLFPADLTETIEKQFAFQSEIWGGPQRYSPWRGHPRMRMRHMAHAITRSDADEWMRCMTAAVGQSDMPRAYHQAYLQRMHTVALAMVNTSDSANKG